jgi:hypothetical protein
VAFVEDAVLGEEFEDDLAAGLVPDVFKPSDGELFVVFKDGNG